MSPVLSTFSGASARAFGLGYTFSAGAFEHIETITVGAGGAANITFSSISGTYKHLQLRTLARDTTTNYPDGTAVMFLNNDTATNYSYHYILGSGTTASSSGGANQGLVLGGLLSTASSLSNVFGVGVVDILDYSSTSKFKTVRTLGGMDNNGNGSTSLTSTAWRSTSAITSIRISSNAGGNLAQYSSFSLYGVK